MGTLDRLLRTLIAVFIGILYLLDVLTGTWAIIVGTIAIVFLLTSFIGTCPLYLPFDLPVKNQ